MTSARAWEVHEEKQESKSAVARLQGGPGFQGLFHLSRCNQTNCGFLPEHGNFISLTNCFA